MASPYRLPIVGGLTYKAGKLFDLAMTPCNGDPAIMIYGFFLYAPHIFWSLNKPDPIDFLADRFSDRHKRRRRRRFIYDFHDTIPTGPKGSLGWWSLRGVDLTQRIGLYFLIADGTLDFLINWTSMVHEFSGCPVVGAPHASIRTSGTAEFNNFSTLRQIGGMTARSSHIWTTSTTTINQNTNGPSMFMGSISTNVATKNPKGRLIRTLIRKSSGAGIEWFGGEPQDPDPTKPMKSAFVTRDFTNFGTAGAYQLWGEFEPGWLRIGESYLNGSGTLDHGWKPDP